MKPSFVKLDYAPIVGMIQCRTAAGSIVKIKASLAQGAEAIGMQLCKLDPEETTDEKLTAIMEACEDKPVYITSYRKDSNEGKSDEFCASLLLRGLACGGTLCDMPGDAFDPNEFEITENEEAVAKQKAFADKVHAMGGELLISTHDMRDLSAEEVFRIARLQDAHGADIIKIVVNSASMDRLPEYVEVIQRVKRAFGKPFLFLDIGACAKLLRKVGPDMGTCMYLTVLYHGEMDTPAQPLITTVKTIRENMK